MSPENEGSFAESCYLLLVEIYTHDSRNLTDARQPIAVTLPSSFHPPSLGMMHNEEDLPNHSFCHCIVFFACALRSALIFPLSCAAQLMTSLGDWAVIFGDMRIGFMIPHPG